ncbi:hypothetical protein FE257_002618 [Aspergillus nanangensis]|uniref:Metallo-beta-lactamase domain-containing protein n=1 Tax=Aspergillus nanangensis TaxID=2582783 RepID=A0AAD4CCH4_ASPNN|nr:hypothetical protein FE257_002618 [Aspergillus nanangensis]
MTLPVTDAYVHLDLLNGGSMTAEYDKLHAGEPPERFRMYNWAFYIHHPQSGRRLLWDLGMSSAKDDYPPIVSNGPWKETCVLGPHESLIDQIERRERVKPEEIDTIILSHAHWDHCRPTGHIFKNATVLFGPGTSTFCSPGHLSDPLSQWDGRFFDPEHATEHWATLQGPWVEFGLFDTAMDFFGDGSFWVIQAPGHMPGNLCACARLETGEWVMLASDCCHSRALFEGVKEFGTFRFANGDWGCLHMDIAAAKDTLRRLRGMQKDLGVHIALAHDDTWLKDESDSVLLSLLDARFIQDMRAAIPQGKPF